MKREVVVFDQLIEARPGGQFFPRVWVQFDGQKFGPGSSFGPGFKPGGLAIGEWRDRKIFGHREGDVFVVDGIDARPQTQATSEKQPPE